MLKADQHGGWLRGLRAGFVRVLGLVSGLLGGLLGGMSVGSAPAHAETIHIAADDPWCTLVGIARAGDTLRFAPGVYRGGCRLFLKGEPERPITLTSLNPDRPARFASRRPKRDMLVLEDVRHLVIEGLRFGPSGRWADAVRIVRGDHVLIRDNHFQGLGGQAVLAAWRDTHDIQVIGNRMIDNHATAVYIGCHDGRQCRSRDARVEGNLIDGVDVGGNAVGYGIQVKLNSTAVVRGNTVRNTRGPGVMVYGCQDAVSDCTAETLRVENNTVENAFGSDGITVGGGPVMVRGNRVSGSRGFGIYAQNYAKRGLQRGVLIDGNRVWDNLDGGIVTEGWLTGQGNRISANILGYLPGAHYLHPSQPAGDVSDNTLCPAASCCMEDDNEAIRRAYTVD
ncbi:MAG: right-handed parallel beta-helix repeat-containing protein [Gammaproteobacteria bacterium]